MAQTATPIIEGALGVHVLAGEKTGESIIVTLPTEKKPVKWFAVDAFHGRLPGGRKHHAVLSFLNEFDLKLADCVFVLLTHMHQDHYSGIKRLITEREGTTFATHSAYRQDVNAADFFAALEEAEDSEERSTSPSDSAKYCSLSPRAHGIARLCLDHRPFLALNHSNVPYHNVVSGTECYVSVVGPSSQVLSDYFTSTTDSQHAISQALALGNQPQDRIRQQAELINNMSLVIHIEFGATRILLGADAQEKAWNEIANDPTLSGQAHAVGNVLRNLVCIKVPHHGSSNGWCSALEDTGAEWAITTHRTPSGLPEKNVVLDILSTGAKLLVPAGDKLFERFPNLQQHHRPDYPCERIPVAFGTPGRPLKAKQITKSNPGNSHPIFPSRHREVHWASLSFDKNGVVREPYGGSQLAVLCPG